MLNRGMILSINDRLNELRAKMEEVGINVCLIPTSDCHNSEYVSEHFKVREYFSGFTGSAGELLVSGSEAVLFTDSRYFLQAQEELKESTVRLMKMGEPGVPNEDDYIFSLLKEGETLGFDGRLISSFRGEKLEKMLASKNCSIDYDFDPAVVWHEREPVSFNSVYILDVSLTGESTSSKLGRIFSKMDEMKADTHIITTLDDIAWITNMRGSDVECNPVFFSFMVLSMNKAHLYANIDDAEVKKYLSDNGIELHPYENFFEEGLKSVNNWTKDGLLLDKRTLSHAIYKALDNDITKRNAPNPSALMKAVKNATEIENIRKSNIKDGIALVMFNKWLEDSIAAGDCPDELSIAQKLYEQRAMQEGFVEVSFDTICASGPHGAIVHYSADSVSNIPIEKGTFLLIDSGGQYMGGTTDITRTYAIGEVNEKLKHDYTLVLKGMLRLMDLTFKFGAGPMQLDMCVRELFWKNGADYGHSTGHGIGYMLNVHEMPVYVQWKTRGNVTPVIFEPGMLTSDEPGLYRAGEYGIRIENDILCTEKAVNEYGRFLGFESMTLCPIDTSCICMEEMTADDKRILNDYHKKVYDLLKDKLDEEHREYLRKVTEPI